MEVLLDRVPIVNSKAAILLNPPRSMNKLRDLSNFLASEEVAKPRNLGATLISTAGTFIVAPHYSYASFPFLTRFSFGRWSVHALANHDKH